MAATGDSFGLRAWSVDPGVVDWFAVGRVVWAEGEKLKPVWSGFESATDLWGDPDAVQGPDLADLVVEFDLSGAAEDHVDLLGMGVAMNKR